MTRALAFVRWLVRLEIGIWRSLFLWIARRVPGHGPGVQDFSYAKEITPILWAFIFVSALELPVVHLLIPWQPVKLAVLVLSVWGLLWMLGYLASMRVFRHLLDDDGLRVRYGTTVDLGIPWAAVAGVTAKRGRFDARTLQVEDGVAHVPVLKQTRVSVALERPIAVDAAGDVSEVRFYVDDPRGFVVAARGRLG
jgi:hypothetical protein